jgi:uncharacterized repeat protein (TIGR03803 family)
VLSFVSTSPTWAARDKLLHNFVNLPTGANPQAELVADSAGNLYGTTSTGGEHALGAVYQLSRQHIGHWTAKAIYSFTYNFQGKSTDGSTPIGGLVRDSAGNLYGTTAYGGYSDDSTCNFGCGVVFKLSPASGGKWTETVIYRFKGPGFGDGANPQVTLVFDSLGNLYGTTLVGGKYDAGTVFELASNVGGEWTEKIVYSFSGGSDGSEPAASLTFDKSGNLYGTTLIGGDLYCDQQNYRGCGTVFQLVPQNNGQWKESVLHAFEYYLTFQNLSTSLVVDSQGNIFGTTFGGEFFYGSVFRLAPSAGKWIYTTLHVFAGGRDGALPAAGLISDTAGNLYGTTQFGGEPPGGTVCNSFGCGTIFELTPNSSDWTEMILHRFTGRQDGAEPTARLLELGGSLYITASSGANDGCDYLLMGCGTALKLSPGRSGKWTAEPLYDFTAVDGFDPQGPLIADGEGNFYGTTNQGGRGPGYFEGNGGQDCPYGCGTVFKLVRSSSGSWTRTIVYSFTGINGDGSFPAGNLVFDPNGNLYGTTEWGGKNGVGSVFELMPTSNGTYKEFVIYSFASTSDGARPLAGLVFDKEGNLYGTTQFGGSQKCSCGTAFELSPSGGAWKERILYSFTGTNGDGAIPKASLVFDSAGRLYGTTSLGGGGACGGFCGTAFQLSPVNGRWTETVLYSFGAFKGDGAPPVGGLVLDGSGNLYGATSGGGSAKHCGIGFTGCGTIFRLTPGEGGAWTETILYNFGNYPGDAKFPAAGLTFDAEGALYGVGGGSKQGSVFKLTPVSGGKWTEGVIYRFAGYPSDGAGPASGVIFDAEGNLYGTTSAGGAGGGGGYGGFQSFGGTVFKITP